MYYTEWVNSGPLKLLWNTMEDFNDQQNQALKAVKTWLSDTAGPQIFRLFGFAGTGKTTLAKYLASEVNGIVLFGAYTGKAASVLRSKGCFGASTIHSMIYHAEQDEETGIVSYRINRSSPVSTADLVIIDEVSMVGDELALDLLSYGKKILVLGDPYQLPPVASEGYFINKEPDIMLTEIHRQAKENPIIRLSMDVRSGKRLSAGTYGQSQVLSLANVDKDHLADYIVNTDQVLCGTNNSRVAFNNEIRELAGLSTPTAIYPVVGDKLICLKNDKDKQLFNGSMWHVAEIKRKNDKTIYLKVASDDNREHTVGVEVLNQFFVGNEKDIDWKQRRKYDEFTYGWAITCHKAQGSQWNHVTVIDESYVFRDSRLKWLYTAITRASEKVTIIV